MCQKLNINWTDKNQMPFTAGLLNWKTSRRKTRWYHIEPTSSFVIGSGAHDLMAEAAVESQKQLRRGQKPKQQQEKGLYAVLYLWINLVERP